MERHLAAAILLIFLAFLAWNSWQPPASPTSGKAVRAYLPQQTGPEAGLWRVVTRKIIWKQAAMALKKRLEEKGFRVVSLTRREQVVLHAFDDSRTFSSLKAAQRARANWKKLKIEAGVTKKDGKYAVALGRFYLPEYAERMRISLAATGKKFRYERREVKIPVYRYTFAPGDRKAAEKLWKQVQALGVAEPELMAEKRFQELFGKPDRSGPDSGKQ
jgi:hypothetical protein